LRKIIVEKEYFKEISFDLEESGEWEISVMLVCDSYIGTDIESDSIKIIVNN
jgi:hypothetical protein